MWETECRKGVRRPLVHPPLELCHAGVFEFVIAANILSFVSVLAFVVLNGAVRQKRLRRGFAMILVQQLVHIVWACN